MRPAATLGLCLMLFAVPVSVSDRVAMTGLIVYPSSSSLMIASTAVGGRVTAKVVGAAGFPNAKALHIGVQPGIEGIDAVAGRVVVDIGTTSQQLVFLNAATGAFINRAPVPLAGATAATVSTRLHIIAIVSSAGQYSSDAGAVTWYDTRSGRLMRQEPTGANPQGVAVDDVAGRVLAMNQADDSVNVIDLRTGRTVRTTTVGASPSTISVDTTTHRAYALSTKDKTITVLDSRDGHFIENMGAGNNVESLLAVTRTHRLFVLYCPQISTCGDDTYAGNGSLEVRDARTGAILHQIGLGVAPTFIQDRPDLGGVEIYDFTDNRITLLDASTGGKRRVVSLGNTPMTGQIVPSRGRVITVSKGQVNGDGKPFGDAELTVSDITTGRVVYHRTVPQDTYNVEVDETAGQAYLTNSEQGTLTLIPLAKLP